MRLHQRYRAHEQLFGQEAMTPESSGSQIARQVPIGKGFQVKGLWGRNNRPSKDIESLLGVSYNVCRWSVEAAPLTPSDLDLAWVNG